MTIKCPNNSHHEMTFEQADSRFEKWICPSCHAQAYVATHKDEMIDMQPTQIYDDYELIEFQEDINDERGFDLMCSEAQRLFYR